MRKFTARFTKTAEAVAFAAHIGGPGWSAREITQRGRTVTWLSNSTSLDYTSDMQETVHAFGSPEFTGMRTKSNTSWITRVEDVPDEPETPTTADLTGLTGQALKDAIWVLSFTPGSRWHTGAFAANREAELVRARVLIWTGTVGEFTVGRAAEPETEQAETATDLGNQGARETFGETDDTDGSDAPDPRRAQVVRVFEESFEDTGYPTDAIDRIMAIFAQDANPTGDDPDADGDEEQYDGFDAQEPDQADRAQIMSRFEVRWNDDWFLVWDVWTNTPATDDRFVGRAAAQTLRETLTATELERAGL